MAGLWVTDLLECQYGSLPGYWTGVDEEESYRWNLYDKKCRLKRLLEVHTTVRFCWAA